MTHIQPSEKKKKKNKRKKTSGGASSMKPWMISVLSSPNRITFEATEPVASFMLFTQQNTQCFPMVFRGVCSNWTAELLGFRIHPSLIRKHPKQDTSGAQLLSHNRGPAWLSAVRVSIPRCGITVLRMTIQVPLLHIVPQCSISPPRPTQQKFFTFLLNPTWSTHLDIKCKTYQYLSHLQ